MSKPVANYEQSVGFCQRYFGEQPRHIVSIVEGKSPNARTFQPNEDAELAAHIKRQNEKGENIYFSVNELAETAWNKKAQKPDVTRVTALHCDLDDLAAEALQKATSFRPKPSVVLCSGGGDQAFWIFRQATSSTSIAVAKAINKAIAERVGGDACHNIDRIMRVPGTINHPNAKKKAAGRTPVAAYLIEECTDFDRRCELSDFKHLRAETGEVSVANIEALSANSVLLHPKDIGMAESANQYRTIIDGDDPEHPIGSEKGKPSRSELRFSVIMQLVKLDYTVEQISGLLLNTELGISQSILDRQSGDPSRLVHREIQKATAFLADSWPDTYKSGIPRPSYMNAIFGLRKLGITFSTNTFQNRKQIDKFVLQEFEGDITDDTAAMLRQHFVDVHGFDVGKQNLFDALQVLCIENSYHPIRDYLNTFEHDGIARIERFFVDYAEAEDTPLNRAISRLMFVAAVRRVRNPGCKYDTMIVIEGKQGSGKSSLLKILAGEENFSDQNLFSMDQKAQGEALDGVWIFEVAELSGLRHAEISAVKATLSRAEDQFRAAYARFKTRSPRQSIFVATTNDDQYLKDVTGNRRFLPILTNQIDLEGVKRDRGLLWAEASILEADGVPIMLPRELWEDARITQEERRPIDPWIDQLQGIKTLHKTDGMERISTKELFGEAYLNLSTGQMKDFHAKRLAEVMRQLGWGGPKPMRINGETKRGYERAIDNKNGGEDDLSY